MGDKVILIKSKNGRVISFKKSNFANNNPDLNQIHLKIITIN